jgi:hypothetical protein
MLNATIGGCDDSARTRKWIKLRVRNPQRKVCQSLQRNGLVGGPSLRDRISLETSHPCSETKVWRRTRWTYPARLEKRQAQRSSHAGASTHPMRLFPRSVVLRRVIDSPGMVEGWPRRSGAWGKRSQEIWRRPFDGYPSVFERCTKGPRGSTARS